METEQKPSVVVGTFIIGRDKKLLLVKNPKWGDQWMIPGGHIEFGESAFDAAKREAMEEVGLKVKPLGILAIGEEALPKTFTRKKHFIYLEIICSATSKKVKMDGREAINYRWFEIKDAIKYAKHPLIKRVLKEYTKQSKKGKFNFIKIGLA
ncbi:MAG: NUDIX hydrolase [Candidatus Micrarchaeota archaeon]|nr:NUDIX hydrolase [Candidatus Micrarchaeota archaeon]